MTLRNFSILFTLMAIGGIVSVQGQRSNTSPKLEDLPRRAIDTLSTQDDETKVIIYSNNTWSYYRPTLLNKYDDLPVYQKHWDTTQVFAYRTIELSDLPSAVDLKLISTMDEFHPPIIGRVFSKYGPRGRRSHKGVDIPLQTGEPIYAVFEGKIRYSKYNTGGYGNLVIIRHKNGLETWYAHLSKRNVAVNEYVKAGQVIGFGGSTGRSRGPHLHFETRYCDQNFDPEYLFDFENGQLKYQTFALERSFLNIYSRASDQLEEEDDEGYLALLTENIDSDSTSADFLERVARAQAKPDGINPGGPVYHTVRSGDILGRIAQKYGVSIDQICRLNNIKRTTILQIGRKLRIR